LYFQLRAFVEREIAIGEEAGAQGCAGSDAASAIMVRLASSLLISPPYVGKLNVCAGWM